jgi:hypothetical protein
MLNRNGRFTVRAEVVAFPRGKETVQVEESYTDWQRADTAYLAWRSLSQLSESKVQFVELIEHREEVVHKTATKPDAPTNVVVLGSVANANG